MPDQTVADFYIIQHINICRFTTISIHTCSMAYRHTILCTAVMSIAYDCAYKK